MSSASLTLPGYPGLRPARAVVFDKDGVLVDFRALWCAIAQARAERVIARAARPATEVPLLLSDMGLRNGDIDPTGPLATSTRRDEVAITASYLYRSGMDWLEAHELVLGAFLEGEHSVDPETHLRPTGDLAPMLRHLQELGVPLAVATSDTTEGAERDLTRLGLRRYFTAVIGADQVQVSKPDPAMLRLACQQLGVRASEVWMVGDALSDLEMARRGGAAGAIGVTSGVSGAAMLRPHADVVLAGAWDLQAAQLG